MDAIILSIVMYIAVYDTLPAIRHDYSNFM